MLNRKRHKDKILEMAKNKRRDNIYEDWGLGIGDWANPQSPIPNPNIKYINVLLEIKLFKLCFIKT
jgi:hypothetical protein